MIFGHCKLYHHITVFPSGITVCVCGGGGYLENCKLLFMLASMAAFGWLGI